MKSSAKPGINLKRSGEHFLDMGRRCAVLTLPYPHRGWYDRVVLCTPFIKVSDKGVNVLSKILLSLYQSIPHSLSFN